MAIKNFPNKAAYDAAAKPTIESQVSMIETSREVIVDGVNVITKQPTIGDVLFLDENSNKIFVKGGAWLQKANIPAAWTHVGYVYFRKGNEVGIINKTGSDLKYADVLQYAITAISSTSLTINLRIQDTSKSGDAQYATNIPVAVTLTSADINATSAAEISAAVAAKATELGDTAAWWAYLADANGNKVDENGTQIIVQCDTWKNWQQYQCSASGGTIAFAVWGDMPASDVYFKNNGKYSQYRGLMNIDRGEAYWATNGRTPDANIPVGSEAGNTNPVTKSAFETSAYCAELRAYYKTYRAYLYGEFGVAYPQKYGTFALPSAKELSDKYAGKTAPTKDGGTKAAFPAMAACKAVSYGVENLDSGDWYLPSSLEGCYLLDDANLTLLQASISVMGTTAVNNSTNRWFAERCSVGSARYFYGSGGTLGYNGVFYALRAQAVALLVL